MPFLVVVLLAFASLQVVANAASSQPDYGKGSGASTTRTSASITKTTGKARFIVHTKLAFIRAQIATKGCEVIHELADATAVICPEGVSIANSEPDRVLHILDVWSDSQIRADQVWALGYTGSGATVAVLDTGVDATHPELASSIAGGRSFVSYTTSYADDNGHGTHVSGIITSDGIVNAASKGVAYNAQVWMAKVCSSIGECYDSDMVAAIQYIVNNHIAKVMSISIGGGGTTGPNCDSDYLAQQINWAYNYGVVSVIAAGNSDTKGIVESPGCASTAIAVAAVDSSDSIAYFSDSGNALQDHGVAAPGYNILSTIPGGGYASWSGTSMATPHVSATVALMLEKNPNLAQAGIRSIILGSANCLGGKYGSCPNIKIGYGRVDALSAILNTAGGNRTVTSTVTSTSDLPVTITTTVTSYTSTSTVTSTVPSFTTVVLFPLTVTSIIESIQYLTSILTTTVTSYTGTELSTSTVMVPQTVTVSPSTVTETVESTQVLTSTNTSTVTSYTTTTATSYTGTETVTSNVPAVTTVVLVPQTVTATVPGTQLVTSTTATTTTSYADTSTSTITSLVYTTVTASGGGGASSPLMYLGFLSLLAVTVGHKVAAGKVPGNTNRSRWGALKKSTGLRLCARPSRQGFRHARRIGPSHAIIEPGF